MHARALETHRAKMEMEKIVKLYIEYNVYTKSRYGK